MITLREKFPDFEKIAVVSTESEKEFVTLDSSMLINDSGNWTVFFWWPKDFTFICPTEITQFNAHFDDFQERNAQLIGASTDSEYVHLAWRRNHGDLRELRFPMLADTSKSLAEELGILEPKEKVAYRSTFIIDSEGLVRWISVYEMNVGRKVDEVLRVLDALQTEEMCPCNWEKGEQTLNI